MTNGTFRMPNRWGNGVGWERRLDSISAKQDMDLEIIGAAIAVVGALLWIRRDLRHDIAEIRADVRALNGRIDSILLADRPPKN